VEKNKIIFDHIHLNRIFTKTDSPPNKPVLGVGVFPKSPPPVEGAIRSKHFFQRFRVFIIIIRYAFLYIGGKLSSAI